MFYRFFSLKKKRNKEETYILPEMPVLMSPEIANKFKEEWMMLHPEDQENVSGSIHFDDSLTSLHWLQNFSILSANPERTPTFNPQHLFYHKNQLGGTDSPSSPPAGDTAATGMPQTPGNPTTSCSSLMNAYVHQQTGHYITAQTNPSEEIDYKTNRHVKPPYSYATLICMAMQASNKTKITLSAIYSWITENFCYYRYAEPSWQVTSLFLFDPPFLFGVFYTTKRKSIFVRQVY